MLEANSKSFTSPMKNRYFDVLKKLPEMNTMHQYQKEYRLYSIEYMMLSKD
jgi:hypothetical protein